MVYVSRDDGKEHGNYYIKIGCIFTGMIKKKMDITMLSLQGELLGHVE